MCLIKSNSVLRYLRSTVSTLKPKTSSKDFIQLAKCNIGAKL